jgi:two-component system, LytTR family, response regulator
MSASSPGAAGTARRLRALIVDDEPLARERIRTLLADETDIEIAGECADGREAVAAISAEAPDLLFLDVQMPELGGFEVLEAVGIDRVPAVIFVTAYDRHALRAFDVHALDYLLKPFDRERFHAALTRARGELARGPRAARAAIEPRLLALLEEMEAGKNRLERLVIKSGGRVFFLRVAEIDWIEAAGNYARLHVGRESHLLRETMKTLEARLDPGGFVRVHRSAIVNIDRIQELQPSFHGEYVITLIGSHRLTSSRGYSERLHDLLGRVK